MNLETIKTSISRRTFLSDSACGIGLAALGGLLSNDSSRGATIPASTASPALPHFAPRAKQVLCLFQSEGFSHVDLFDNKPTLAKFHAQELPPSIKGNQRLTGMTSGQGKYLVAAPVFPGRYCGDHQTWI